MLFLLNDLKISTPILTGTCRSHRSSLWFLILERDCREEVPDADFVVGAARHKTETVRLGVKTQNRHV